MNSGKVPMTIQPAKIRTVRCDELVMPRRFFVYRRRRNFMAPPLQQFLQALQK
ncbi:MAG: hypothetical protein ACREXP_26575 [Steroidobacteraceae bacterium]